MAKPIFWTVQEWEKLALGMERFYPHHKFMQRETFTVEAVDFMAVVRNVLPKARQREITNGYKVKHQLILAFQRLRERKPTKSSKTNAPGKVFWQEPDYDAVAAALHAKHPELGFLHQPFENGDIKGLSIKHVIDAAKCLPVERQRDLKALTGPRPHLVAAFKRLRAIAPPPASAPLAPPAVVNEAPAPITHESEKHAVKVFWRDDDILTLARELHRINPHSGLLKSTTCAGLKPADLKAAMHILPPHRRRPNLHTVSDLRAHFVRAFAVVRREIEDAEARKAAEAQQEAVASAEPLTNGHAIEEPVFNAGASGLNGLNGSSHASGPDLQALTQGGSLDQLAQQFGKTLGDLFASAFSQAFMGRLSQTVSAAVPKLMADLVETVQTTPATHHEPARACTERAPSVLIVGPLPSQGNELVKTYPQLRLRIVSGSTPNLKDQAKTADRVIAMTKFISHAAEKLIRSASGDRFHRVDGGVSSIKHLLDIWCASGALPSSPVH